MRAGGELARCLSQMTGKKIAAQVRDGFNGGPDLYIGPVEKLESYVGTLQVEDPRWDDAYRIASVEESLVIAGVNARSILIGAYEYLRSLGAEWLWPGADGERLPRIAEVTTHGFQVTHLAASRHRGVCIEGAPALEHVLDMVDWMPRVGLNSYFLQFQVSSCFWRNWYGHELNPRWSERKQLSDDECAELDEAVIRAVKERGLLLHRVGHGWTAAALGLPANGWESYEGALSECASRLVAEVDGHRELWRGCPNLTELCYSNPEARRRMVEVVLEYAAAHPEVDMLHFWLADSVNNNCECGDCRRLSASDWYAILLNELSPRLKRTAPQMKLAFLAYLNTLWPPGQVRLDLSSGNLVYMFAPISRCYGHRLGDPACGTDGELVQPGLNKLSLPSDNQDNCKLLDLWRSARPQDSFAFDYHFLATWHDHLAVRLAQVVADDITDYAERGIHGLMNCASQRAFYPSAWPFWAMARRLWGQALDGETKARYFAGAYGDNAGAAVTFLDGLAEAAGSPLHGRSWWDGDTGRADRVLAWLGRQRVALREGAATARSKTEERCWKLLVHYHRLLEYLWPAVKARRTGRFDEARTCLQAAQEFLQETERETAPALDTFLLLQHLESQLQ